MSEKRFVAQQIDVFNEDETEVWDIVFDTENPYAFMVRDTDTASDLCNLLNEQQEEISYWKHRVSSLLWILGQFDEQKVKKLLEELDE